MNLLVKNDLFDYKNRYIMQFENAFKFSLDSLLLAEFVSVKKTDKNVLDMCTGNAPVPLILSLKTNSFITGLGGLFSGLSAPADEMPDDSFLRKKKRKKKKQLKL